MKMGSLKSPEVDAAVAAALQGARNAGRKIRKPAVMAGLEGNRCVVRLLVHGQEPVEGDAICETPLSQKALMDGLVRAARAAARLVVKPNER